MKIDQLTDELQIVLQEHLATRRYLTDGQVIAALTMLVARALYHCTETQSQAEEGPRTVVRLILSEYQRLCAEAERESAN